MLRNIILATSIALNAALLFWIWFMTISMDPELSNKPEYSLLENLGAMEPQTDSNLIVRKNVSQSGYDVVALPDSAPGRRVWLLANAQKIPTVKIMPAPNKIRITSEQFRTLEKSIQMNDDVRLFLRNAITDQDAN